jgi:DUF2911 family protein
LTVSPSPFIFLEGLGQSPFRKLGRLAQKSISELAPEELPQKTDKETNMKRKWVVIWAAAVLTALPSCGWTQRNPRAKAEVTVGGTAVSIDYGRPSLRGRTVTDLLSQLPPGGFWRLGADQSTTFTTSGDLSFGDVKVPKGTYSLWAQKQADRSWKLVFNQQHGQWGTDHDASKDFASVPLKETKADDSAEQVTIALAKAGDGGALTIRWGDMKLSTDFK